jgi:hypothetical protein
MTGPSGSVEQLADLASIGAGAMFEKFEKELERVIENIRDHNTMPGAKRKVTLEYAFIPSDDRRQVVILLSARSTLAATRPTADTMWIGTQDGKQVATVVHPLQVGDPAQGVLPLREPKEREGTSDD